MAFSFSPKIVTDGLIFAVDAANNRSYNIGSNMWFDLTRDNYSGSLTNGPTFSSTNAGSIVFDGSNDYILFPDSNNLNVTTLTVLASFYITQFPGFSQYRVINHQQNQNKAWGYQMARADYAYGGPSDQMVMFCHSNNGLSAKNLHDPTFLSINTWYHGGFSNDGTNLKIYLNGRMTNSTAALGLQDNNISANLAIGVTSEGLGQFFWKGNIAAAQIYNRALSATEVLQNYNATKGRFNLT